MLIYTKIIEDEQFWYRIVSFNFRNGILDAYLPYGFYPSILDYLRYI